MNINSRKYLMQIFVIVVIVAIIAIIILISSSNKEYSYKESSNKKSSELTGQAYNNGQSAQQTTGQTRTYSINGANYEITLTEEDRTNNCVKLSINGEITQCMHENERANIQFGNTIGIDNLILTQGDYIASFFFGNGTNDTLRESQTRIFYNIIGIDYAITPVWIESSCARMSINGWNSPCIVPGESILVADTTNVYIYVHSIGQQAGINTVSFDIFGGIIDTLKI